MIGWMHNKYDSAWKERRVPEHCPEATIVLVYKEIENKSECSSHIDISLLSISVKVNGKILIEKVHKITQDKVSDDQGRFKTWE